MPEKDRGSVDQQQEIDVLGAQSEGRQWLKFLMIVSLFSKFSVQLKIKMPPGQPGGIRCARVGQALIQGQSSL